ncbi:hypothetical protein [Clostridium botulinum]|nr:hypothetical protein [Clostridium botulinum]
MCLALIMLVVLGGAIIFLEAIVVLIAKEKTKKMLKSWIEQI